MKKVKLFVAIMLALVMCLCLTACDLFGGGGDDDGPADYTPNAGEYDFYGGFTVKTPYVDSYEEYMSDPIDDIFADYETLLMEIEAIKANWSNDPSNALTRPPVNSVQDRYINMTSVMYDFCTRETNLQMTMILTVDEEEKTGTMTFRTGYMSSSYQYPYQDIAFGYDDNGVMTITDTRTDANYLRFDGNMKFNYEDGDVTVTFDVSGYLKGAELYSGMSPTDRTNIPTLTVAMTFN